MACADWHVLCLLCRWSMAPMTSSAHDDAMNGNFLDMIIIDCNQQVTVDVHCNSLFDRCQKRHLKLHSVSMPRAGAHLLLGI